MVFYCGSNLRSVDCGCDIRPPCSSLKEFVFSFYILITNQVLSTRRISSTLRVLRTSSVCVIAFYYIVTARNLLESSNTISEETQNPQLNKRENTAKVC